MQLVRKFIRVGMVGLLLLGLFPASAKAATPPDMIAPAGLSFVELKVTGDEFVVLENNTGTDIHDLSSYWLENFNNVNPLAAGVNNSAQQLPSVGLAAGQTLLLSAATMPTCGAAVAGKLSLSLTDSGGFLELVQLGQNASGAVTQTPGDVVSWSSSNSGIIQKVPSSSKDPAAAYYRFQSGSSYSWQQADLEPTNICQLNVVVQTGTPAQSIVPTLGQAGSSPPATIVSLPAAPALAARLRRRCRRPISVCSLRN